MADKPKSKPMSREDKFKELNSKMPSRKEGLAGSGASGLNKKLKEFSGAAKEKMDQFLVDNVVTPALDTPLEKPAAGFAAALHTAGELLIPEDLGDVALSVVGPGAKLVTKGVEKGMAKIVKPLKNWGEKEAPKVANVINYKDLKMPSPITKKPIPKGPGLKFENEASERAALSARSKASEKNPAATHKYQELEAERQAKRKAAEDAAPTYKKPY